MPKIKKLRRKKRFKVNVNRKRLRNRLRKLPSIECEQIKDAWSLKKSTINNLAQMGLTYDPNKTLKIPNVKEEMISEVKNNDENINVDSVKKRKKTKLHVVQSLEEEAKYPRARLFRLPQNEIQFATYMMDKYGEDYKAMIKDRKNYNQLTWRQIKRKIDKFKSIPEHYAEYLVKKGEIILEDSTPLKKIKPSFQVPEVNKNSKSKRKKKKPKLIKSIWQEEIVNNESVNECIDVEKDVSNDGISTKKLKLFVDDESESNNKINI